jgi:hypothetical protein
MKTPTPRHVAVDASGEMLQVASSHNQKRVREIGGDVVLIHISQL